MAMILHFFLQAERMSTQREFSSDLEIIGECLKHLSENNVLPYIWDEHRVFDGEKNFPKYSTLLETVEDGLRLAKREDSKTMEPSYKTMVNKLTNQAHKKVLKAMFYGISRYFSCV